MLSCCESWKADQKALHKQIGGCLKLLHMQSADQDHLSNFVCSKVVCVRVWLSRASLVLPAAKSA